MHKQVGKIECWIIKQGNPPLYFTQSQTATVWCDTLREAAQYQSKDAENVAQYLQGYTIVVSLESELALLWPSGKGEGWDLHSAKQALPSEDGRCYSKNLENVAVQERAIDQLRCDILCRKQELLSMEYRLGQAMRGLHKMRLGGQAA